MRGSRLGLPCWVVAFHSPVLPSTSDVERCDLSPAKLLSAATCCLLLVVEPWGGSYCWVRYTARFSVVRVCMFLASHSMHSLMCLRLVPPLRLCLLAWLCLPVLAGACLSRPPGVMGGVGTEFCPCCSALLCLCTMMAPCGRCIACCGYSSFAVCCFGGFVPGCLCCHAEFLADVLRRILGCFWVWLTAWGGLACVFFGMWKSAQCVWCCVRPCSVHRVLGFEFLNN